MSAAKNVAASEVANKADLQTDDLLPWLAAQRNELLATQGHAFLLHGPSGLGQYALALSLVQAWLCESTDHQTQEAADRKAHAPACGQCASCLQIKARSHTDLVVLMPETLMLELGWPLGEKAQKELDDKKRKPSQEIRIDDVRTAVGFAELTSGRGRGKAILVYPAESLNTASANALLKTLEEPQGGLRFVLASEASHQLLPTIRSRCQAFALRWPSQAESLAWLNSQMPNAASHTLEGALAATGGRALDALQWIASGAESSWSRVPLAMQKGQVQAVAGWAPGLLLDALHKLCHDLWASKLGVAPRFFAPQDLPKAPPARALAAWSEQLKSLSRTIDHTWKAELLLEDMVAQAKLCINSRS